MIAPVRLRFSLVLIAGAVSAATTIGWRQPPGTFLITNANVIDGTGAASRRAAVRVTGERIAAVGALTPHEGEPVVDAGDLTLAPGFIDTHSHHDRGLQDASGALAAISQGITTIVVGQDGSSAFPLSDFFSRFERSPATVNIASYAGHGTLRRQVLGEDYKRVATPSEIGRMQELARAEMNAGALGLSTGLEYDPGLYSQPSEVLALGRTVASLGGRYISHIRSEDRALFEAVGEVIELGRQTGMPVQVSHIKLAMRGLWGQADKLIAMLDKARASGVRITADIYPYTYWQSSMTVLFPKRDFRDRAEAEFVLRELVAPDGLLIVGFEGHPEYVGKTLAEIARARRTDAASTVMALIEESGGRGPTVVATSMDEKDVERLIRWPHANICSDGTLTGGHPRGFGAFPRVLGRYVRERRLIPLEEAIRRMTSLSAANVGISGRGTIAPGQAADLVLFNPATITDRATTADSRAMSEGVRTVWVNGEMVFEKGSVTAKRPGRVLRRTRASGGA
jgi:N-acyl-D-amino-acid deacylase